MLLGRKKEPLIVDPRAAGGVRFMRRRAAQFSVALLRN